MNWLLYGATGYTGRLIAREAVRRGLRPILGGRSAGPLEALAKELDLPARVLVPGEPAAALRALADVDLVLNCAGPFSATFDAIANACLSAGAHYLDITGEIDVFERARTFDARARAANVVVCPGVGFDVVPTDCIALMLKESLPSATELALGFDGSQTLSPGTAKTVVENLGSGGKIRRDGRIVSVPLGWGVRRIDFGTGPKYAMAVPWGDVSTAYATTGIATVAVYRSTPRATIVGARVLGAFGFAFRSGALVRALQRRIERSVRGPDAAALASDRTYVWGEVRDPSGATRSLRLVTANPYALTVTAALGIVERLLAAPAAAGATTPALLMGARYVLDLPGTYAIA